MEVVLKQGESIRGDVDGNGLINIEDVTLLVDVLLSGSTSFDMVAADCNLDGEVNINDVTLLVDYLLSGAW